MAALNKRRLEPGERIRVLVVDDSAVVRRLIIDTLAQDSAIEVAGTASNGATALKLIAELNPDVLTLDIEMPEMNGLEVVSWARRERPHLRIIMLSTLTEKGAPITLEALTLGAHDYVAKPSQQGSLNRSIASLREELIPRIRQFFNLGEQLISAGGRETASDSAAVSLRWSPNILPKAVAIGVSTGGPAALGAILPRFPATFPVPVLVVQHMPPVFTRSLAERLRSACSLYVGEARHGDPVNAGSILIAPGGFHMRLVSVRGSAFVRLDQSPPQNSCRPSIDCLFDSAGEVFGGAVLAVMLTGMGHDGLRGTQALKALGASVLVQDEASSVVWGMAGAVVKAGLADRVAPLDRIPSEILRIVQGV